MPLVRLYAELALSDLNLRSALHSDCFGGALPTLHAHEPVPGGSQPSNGANAHANGDADATASSSSSSSSSLFGGVAIVDLEAMPRLPLSLEDDELDRLAALLAVTRAAMHCSLTMLFSHPLYRSFISSHSLSPLSPSILIPSHPPIPPPLSHLSLFPQCCCPEEYGDADAKALLSGDAVPAALRAMR